MQTAALLVPHSAILEDAVISAPFVRAHTIVLNPENPKQFLTLNGTFGAFVKVAVAEDEEEQRNVHVLQPDPPPAETLNPLVDVPSYFLSVKGCFETAKSVRSIPVLREVRSRILLVLSLLRYLVYPYSLLWRDYAAACVHFGCLYRETFLCEVRPW